MNGPGYPAMRIAILSDTHSRYATVETALKKIDERGVELILHCGDIDDAETVWLFPGNTHFVFGNCDTDKTSIRQAVYGIGAELHDKEPYGDLRLPEARIAFIHGDIKPIMLQLEHSGDYDYL